MKTKLYLLTAIILLTGILLVACKAPSPATSPATSPAPASASTAKPAAAQPQSGGVVKFIFTGFYNISSLDAPVDATRSVSGNIFSAMADPLLSFDEKNQPVPCLATAMDVAPDGKTITLTLRKGVKFQDGTDFNTAAVKYHIQNYKYANSQFANIKSIDVIDDYTLKFNLSAYDATLPLNLNMYGMVCSLTASQKATTPDNRVKDHLVAAGPFKLVDWQRDNFVKTTRFDGYWQKGKPYLDGMEYQAIADQTVAVMALEKGQAQMLITVSPKDAESLKEKGFKIKYGMNSAAFLGNDGSNADSPFADKRVRQAVEYAIDKKAVADAMGRGFWTPLSQICPPHIYMGYNPDIQGRSYDPAKAKQLLTEAGYPTGFKTKIIASTTADREVLTAIQTYLNNAGISTELDIADPVRFASINKEGWHNGLMLTQAGINSTEIRPIKAFFDSRGVNNRSIFRAPGFQQTLEQAIAEPNPEIHRGLMQKLVRMMYDEAMVTPLWATSDICVMQQSVQDVDILGPSAGWTPGNVWLSK
jgi:ABC-type transport system substrate-binding protein